MYLLYTYIKLNLSLVSFTKGSQNMQQLICKKQSSQASRKGEYFIHATKRILRYRKTGVNFKSTFLLSPEIEVQ